MNDKTNQKNHDLREIIKSKILVLDGGMGTYLQQKNLSDEDYGGAEYEGCHENLNLTKPEVIADIHNVYLDAGANIIETNTFGGTPLVLAEYNLQDKAYEINVAAAKIARECADRYAQNSPEVLRFVCGSMGPTTKSLTVTGGTTFNELIDHYYIQAKGLYDGGVDYFLLETCQDTRNIKAGLIAIKKLNDELKMNIPVAVSVTIETMGTLLAGQTVEAVATSLEHYDLLYLGLNCATGPEFMTDYIRSIADLVETPIACVPNAGLPDEDGNYLETPEMLTGVVERFVNEGWISLVGGCCGTHQGHIRSLAQMVKERTPQTRKVEVRAKLSGVDYLEIAEDNRPYLVGERTNVIGSRKFKRLVSEGKLDEAAEIAKAQVKKGAHIIDVCLSNPDRDELIDTKEFYEILINKIRAPLMIDSTDEKVIEEALTYSQGKAIINSINLEDGEERFEKVVPIAHKFGASFVVGTIDEDPEQGMGVTLERKKSIAKRSFDLLTKKYGVRPEDIYWDPLVFPCATGDENYIGSAVHTIDACYELKKDFPGTKTVLGVSNVSFGLPPAGREVLNSVFLYHCTKKGLDLAIVNTEKVKRFASLSEEDIKLSEDLLWNRGDDPIGKFAAFYRDKKVEKSEPKENLPIEERLGRYILEGVKQGLYEDLDTLMKEMDPMSIINGPLMKGMQVVGKLFNENKLIVAEVLQSAEVMKSAVAHLEPHMESAEETCRGTIVLATVKGDVHDIGKNLVDIVLSNNGFKVINLGIKINSDELIKACKEHKPDILGLSGLLVKSAQQMVISADDLKKAGVDVPLMVGGAALSEKFVHKRIAKEYDGTVIYARDAMNGLDLANKVVNPADFDKLKGLIAEKIVAMNESEVGKKKLAPQSEERAPQIDILKELPEVPDYKRHVIKNTPLNLIWNYVNPLMIYGRHLGIKGKLVRMLKPSEFSKLEALEGGEKAIQIYNEIESVWKEYEKTHLFPKAVYQFFKVASEKNEILFFNEEEKDLVRIKFPRQRKEKGLCLADYVTPLETIKAQKHYDNLCLFVVTVGEQVREEAQKLKDAGEFLRSHILSVLALELAEGYAEYLHSKVRAYWGRPDPIGMTMMERFQAKYEGKRYSFGYPACPKLDDQKILFDLLKPKGDIGVELTEGFMMEPEASVSGLIFHHGQASYYSVGDQSEAGDS